jgi:hypothetical protein
MGTLDFT